MAALVTVQRYVIAWEGELSGESGDQLAEWRMYVRPGDDDLELTAEITSGAVGVRFDGDVLDRATLSSSGVATASLEGLSGFVTCQLFARAAGTTTGLIEAHVQRIEAR